MKRIGAYLLVLLIGADLGAIGCWYFLSQAVARARAPAHQESQLPHWSVRSRHFVFGMPQTVDGRYNFTPPGSNMAKSGVSVLAREGFWVGHCDRFKVPLWVCMRWSKRDLKRREGREAPPRSFRVDRELPEYAQADPDHFRGSGFDRGHMAAHADNLAWGDDNCDWGNLMSNIVPQSVALNRGAWSALERAHRSVVSTGEIGSDTVWVIAGSVLLDATPQDTLPGGIGVPHATYKVLGWFDSQGAFRVRGYLFPQTVSGSDLSEYLVPIDRVEELTGLDFFSELDDSTEEELEQRLPESIWEGPQ